MCCLRLSTHNSSFCIWKILKKKTKKKNVIVVGLCIKSQKDFLLSSKISFTLFFFYLSLSRSLALALCRLIIYFSQCNTKNNNNKLFGATQTHWLIHTAKVYAPITLADSRKNEMSKSEWVKGRNRDGKTNFKSHLLMRCRCRCRRRRMEKVYF